MSAPEPQRADAAPGLRRTLRLRHVVFIGLAYMSPLAVFDTFGIVSQSTDGHVPLAYVVITIALLFTAFSYAKMVRVYPSSGSAYTYTRRAINPHLGFLVGWSAMLDYLFLPMINALLSSIYMSAAFPGIPAWVWIIATIVICTALNLAGVQLAVRVNYALVVIELVVAVAFVAFTIDNIASGANGSSFSFDPFASSDVSAVAGGAAILALSFLGFDAVTTLSEETIAPERNIPAAIFTIIAAAACFFIGVTFFMQILFPDVSEVQNIAGASPEMAEYIGGAAFQSVFLGGYLVAVLACGLTQQMSAGRLLYAMGRDGVLLARWFGHVNARTGVPTYNIVLIGVLATSAVFLDLSQAASLINFGAFVAFAFVNLSVIGYYLRAECRRDAWTRFTYLGVPAVGFIINAALWLNLDSRAQIVGGAWAGIGVVHMLVSTRLFKDRPPQFARDGAE